MKYFDSEADAKNPLVAALFLSFSLSPVVRSSSLRFDSAATSALSSAQEIHYSPRPLQLLNLLPLLNTEPQETLTSRSLRRLRSRSSLANYRHGYDYQLDDNDHGHVYDVHDLLY